MDAYVPLLGREQPRAHGLSVKGGAMILLLVILIVLLAASAPAWPYSRSWGYYPSGTLGTILIILIVLMLMGYI
jgi:hypothetical protein